MRVGGLAPWMFCATGVSTLLSPIQALMAFFVPSQPTQASHSQADCPASQSFSKRPTAHHTNRTRTSDRTPAVTKLKVMYEFDPCNTRSRTGRIVISGRMADVCAELDRIALKEHA